MDIHAQLQETLRRFNTKPPEERSPKPLGVPVLGDVAPQPVVDFALWEALAYDIALGDADMQTIATGYALELSQLETLATNTNFCKMLDAKKGEIEQLGSEAAFAIKFRVIANKAAPEFLRRLTSEDIKDKDFLTMYKTAVEMAQLGPKDDSEDNTPVFGPSVTFNIHGVPGLDHLANPPEIVEGDYKEVTNG